MGEEHEYPTPGQMAEFREKVSLGQITKRKMQNFLDSLGSKITLTKALFELEEVMKANSQENYSFGGIKGRFNEDKVNQQPFIGIPTKVYRFSKKISLKNIIAERKKIGDHFECGIVEAITLVTKLIKNNEVQINDKGIIIRLANTNTNTNTDTGNPYWLRVFRYNVDKLSVRLFVADPNIIWDDGLSVVCRAL